MKITVKLFATLRDGRFSAETREFPQGSTAGNVIGQLGLRDEEAALILVNGRHGEPDTALSEGDTVALFPPIGGG